MEHGVHVYRYHPCPGLQVVIFSIDDLTRLCRYLARIVARLFQYCFSKTQFAACEVTSTELRLC